MLNRREIIIYLSGPYTGDINNNILRARKVAIQLWEKGFTVICPHLNTQNFEVDCKIKYEDYVVGDCEIVKRCDIIFMLPEWEDSVGAKEERNTAHLYYKPVVYSMEELEKLIKEKDENTSITA